MVLVDVRDPGNAGTMIRTADAAGVGAVIIATGRSILPIRRPVRASAGSIFHVPVVAGGGAPEVIESLKGWEFVTVGTAVKDGVDYAEFDWRRRIALVFGNEASGLDEDLMGHVDHRVSIPMVGRAESLNVGVSASVLCFEALRQRRTAGIAAGHLAFPLRPEGAPTPGPLPWGSTISGMAPGDQAGTRASSEPRSTGSPRSTGDPRTTGDPRATGEPDA